jgi:ribosomal protein S18 acetylase RimI-like enzyme
MTTTEAPADLRVQRCQKLDQQLFAAISAIWLSTGISNPARRDDLDSVQYNLDNGGIMLLAFERDELLGTLWLSHDFRRLYLHHMAVLPRKQNHGIGRLLLDEALLIAEETGYQAKLEVHQDNPTARHLYQSMGFTDLDGYTVMIRRN